MLQAPSAAHHSFWLGDEGAQNEHSITGNPVAFAWATASESVACVLYLPWPYLCSPPRFRTCPQPCRWIVTWGLCRFSYVTNIQILPLLPGSLACCVSAAAAICANCSRCPRTKALTMRPAVPCFCSSVNSLGLRQELGSSFTRILISLTECVSVAVPASSGSFAVVWLLSVSDPCAYPFSHLCLPLCDSFPVRIYRFAVRSAAARQISGTHCLRCAEGKRCMGGQR